MIKMSDIPCSVIISGVAVFFSLKKIPHCIVGIA